MENSNWVNYKILSNLVENFELSANLQGFFAAVTL